MATQNGASVTELVAATVTAAAALTKANAEALAAANSRLTDLDAEREELIKAITSLGGEVTTRKVRKGRKANRTGARASNSISLREAVARSLTDTPQSPTEIQEKVVKQGYETGSPNFAQMVSQHLSNLGKLRMGKSPVAINEDRGLWKAGSGMERYLANPDNAVEAED